MACLNAQDTESKKAQTPEALVQDSKASESVPGFEERLKALRQAPLYVHIDPSYFIKDGELPSTYASHRLYFDISGLVARGIESVHNPYLYSLMFILSAVYSGPELFLHESAHAARGKALYGVRPQFSWGIESAAPKMGSLKFFMESLCHFELGGRRGSGACTHVDPFVHISDETYDNKATRWLKEALSSAREGNKSILLEAQKDKEKFKFLQDEVEVFAAGVNREVEHARFMAQRMLVGEPVRPESFISFLASTTSLAGYTIKEQGDMTFIEDYLQVLDVKNGVKKGQSYAWCMAVLSGSFWSFVDAVVQTKLVKPKWLFGRILWPNFYTFFTRKGFSALMETAVRLTDKLYVYCGFEGLSIAGKDPLTKKQYSGKEARLGAVWKPLPGMHILSYTLLTGFGGECEFAYYNPSLRCGLSTGFWWASNTTLCGERMANDAPFNKNGNNYFGFISCSFVC